MVLFWLISTAVTVFPALANCAVLPPGAEHRSTILILFDFISNSAGIDAATSCTHQW